LAQMGYQVELFESARTPGGRARQLILEGKTLDNGQHILLGAYHETLRLMRVCGVDLQQAFLRLPLQMRYPDAESGMDFCAPRWPAPLHLVAALIRARGLNREDKMALARFSTSARWMGWQLYTDCSVSELLLRFEQTERIIQLMWRPLCIAALNTPPERASAQVFLRILKDSLGASRAASDMLIPRLDLSNLFPLPAARFIQRHGGNLHLGVSVKSVMAQGSGWKISASRLAETLFDAVVVATPSQIASQLLADYIEPITLPQEAITTCYLQYDAGVRLPHPMLALADQPEQGDFAQYVFDRGHLQADQAGLLAVVISAPHQALALGHAELVKAITQQLSRQLAALLPGANPGANSGAKSGAELQQPLWHKIISEKRATFACPPGLQRPVQTISLPHLVLAGDYTAGPYPATLEGAVRSGVQAAKHLAGIN
jgi:hydroxysqualene dehydroxylase